MYAIRSYYGVVQAGRRVGTGGVDVGGVFGQHDEIGQLRFLGAHEAGEIGIDEATSDFTGTVGTEVHEDHGIAVVEGGGFGTHYAGLDELVVFTALIGGSQGVGGAGVITSYSIHYTKLYDTEMESRMSGQDQAFDGQQDDDGNDFAPVHYLEDKSSDVAAMIESDNWEP